MSDTPQLIKERLDLVDFLKGYIKLVPAGKNFKGLCPFHKEKTPSFMVSPDRGIWHCFGCSVGGDIIKFVMMYENVEFYDALKILAEKAGIEIKTISNRDFHSHNNIYKVMEAAKDFFKSNLLSSQAAQKYLSERGLKPETIQEFELGLASPESDSLMRHLVKSGFNISDIEKAGLILKTERGTYWDRFRSRLMFPIHNHFGKVVAFTGRISPSHESSNVGKYVNSPETPIYQKSKILYGLYKTKNDVRQSNSAVLVEGQMDFLMAWQDGVRNIAATSGTALTQEHLAALRKLSDSVVISFDDDEAGVAAAERAIDLAGAADFNTRVLLITGFKDPADLVQKKPGHLKELVSGALPAMQYYFYKYINSLKGSQIADKKRGIRMVLAKISVLDSAVERSHWLQELSGLTGIEASALSEEMGQVRVNEPVGRLVGTEAPRDNVSRKDLICQRIIGLALNRDDFRDLMKSHVEYFPPLYRGALAKIRGEKLEMKDEKLDDLVAFLNLRSSFDSQDVEEKKLSAEFQELLRELKKEHFKEKLQQLRQDISAAETKGDEDKLSKLLKEHKLIGQEMQNL